MYVFMLSLHGLIRGRDPELGRDADTGGQVTYVLELARALSERAEVDLVELLTRKIDDPTVGPEYAADVERLGPKARIVRLPFGPASYVRKELLWDHLDALVDGIRAYFRRHDRIPDLIHSHYADAGYVARVLTHRLGVPWIHTSHALGRVKRARLLESGMRPKAIERYFNMGRRIEAEEHVLRSAQLVVASTRQEVDKQYRLYDTTRVGGFVVIPPGTDPSRFFPPARSWATPRIRREVDRFLTEPRKPMILAISRAAEVKNLNRLLEAYGSTKKLREAANLVLVLGNRGDIETMKNPPRGVFTQLLLAVDRYDLYGRVALPKRHRPEDVPELYRLACQTRGVFVNPAVSELFGLTLIEAAASGVPVVATRHGGPPDIIRNCRNGLLVNPLAPEDIASALLKILRSGRAWRRLSISGIRGVARHYTWHGHVKKYLRAVTKVLRAQQRAIRPARFKFVRRGRPCLQTVEKLVIADIDNTLIGDREGLRRLLEHLEATKETTAFGAATGRTVDSALEALEGWGVPIPDVLITAVGSEVYYGPNLVSDEGWARHNRDHWHREAVEEALRAIPGLKLQPRQAQGSLKLSYFVDDHTPPVAELRHRVRALGLSASLISSHGGFLDVLPASASKGRAVRYLSSKWSIPLNRVLVAGDSGNDADMLLGDTLGVVVANHSDELAPLRGSYQVYFAERCHAWAILEAFEHYGFFGTRTCRLFRA